MNIDMFSLLVFFIIFIIFYKFYNNQKETRCSDEAIRILVRQAARWATAAKQDKNAMIAVLHANYAQGYLIALRDIATDNQIKSATGLDVLKFIQEITNVQDAATKHMARLCPEYAPTQTYLTKVAGEG